MAVVDSNHSTVSALGGCRAQRLIYFLAAEYRSSSRSIIGMPMQRVSCGLVQSKGILRSVSPRFFASSPAATPLGTLIPQHSPQPFC